MRDSFEIVWTCPMQAENNLGRKNLVMQVDIPPKRGDRPKMI